MGQAKEENIQAPALLILTGASHSGKSSVAQELLDLIPPPVALLGVDRTLDGVLVRPPENRWEQIPLAYDLLEAQLEPLLVGGWFVVLESTFTYVPPDAEPELHLDRLTGFLATAERTGSPSFVVQLRSDEAAALSRSKETGRLPDEIVAATVELHRTAALPPGALHLDAVGASSPQLARLILRAIRNARPSST